MDQILAMKSDKSAEATKALAEMSKAKSETDKRVAEAKAEMAEKAVEQMEKVFNKSLDANAKASGDVKIIK